VLWVQVEDPYNRHYYNDSKKYNCNGIKIVFREKQQLYVTAYILIILIHLNI
jgi:hypothetical protein